MKETKYNPHNHLAILVAVLGNGYPVARIWDWEVMPHPSAQQWLTKVGNNNE